MAPTLNTGGLFRCCVLTFKELADSGFEFQPDTTITCNYCHKPTLRVSHAGDIVHWSRED